MKKTKEQLRQMNFIHKLYDIIQKCLQLLCGMYLFAILAVMPLYFTDGYARIGTNKYEFFEMVTDFGGSAFVALFLLWAVLRMVRKESWRLVLSPLDIAVGAYGVCVLVSYLLSAYHEPTPYGDVWSGAKGWYMGAKTQLSFVGSYFVISRFWSGKWAAIYSALPVSFVVFLLGILNRFDIRPIEMKAATPSFISTIGNMNWYCGYAVIIIFAVVGYFWVKKEKISPFWIIYLYVGFGTLLTQGSLSGLVTLCALFFILYLLSVKSEKRMERLWLLVVILGVAMTTICMVRFVFPKAMNFSDGVIDLFTYSPLAIATLLLGAAMCLRIKRNDNLGVHRHWGRILQCMLIIGGAGYVALLVINTSYPGIIGALSENALFTFDGDYGNGRGASWMAAYKVFTEQDLFHKLFGVGPDGMAMYLYIDASEELLMQVKETFGIATLTNAHCEVLNVLANIGMAGVLAFILNFVCVLRLLYQELAGREKKDSLIVALSVSIMAYGINNIFSFQQVMNGATIYVALGLLGAIEQKRRVPIHRNM